MLLHRLTLKLPNDEEGEKVMATLKPYRVRIGGRETVLRLSDETVKRSYPDAEELKVGPAPTTPEDPKPATRTRKTASK